MPTRAEVDQQRRLTERVTQAALADLEDFWNSLDLRRPEAARDALLEYVPLVVDKYGDVVATLAADFYDETRAQARPAGIFRATTVAAPLDKVTGSTRRLAGFLFTDDPAGALPGLRATVDKFTKQPGRDTSFTSAASDPAHPRWARVPSGATCKFCVVLASRGFVYTSEQSAGGLNDWHDHCNCQAVADFSAHPALAGYDPDALLAEYQSLDSHDRGLLAESAKRAKDRRRAGA